MKLLVNHECWRRNIAEDAACSRCAQGDETLQHTFMDSDFTQEVWRNTLCSSSFMWRHIGDFTQLVKHNSTKKEWLVDNTCWCSKFAYTL